MSNFINHDFCFGRATLNDDDDGCIFLGVRFFVTFFIYSFFPLIFGWLWTFSGAAMEDIEPTNNDDDAFDDCFITVLGSGITRTG